MTAPDLSADERWTLELFDAAPDAPESLRERLAKALAEDADCGAVFDDPELDPEMWETFAEDRDFFRGQADVAIAVMRGDQ